MLRPKTVQQYLELLDQAIFEVDELIGSVEFDEIDEFGPFLPVYEQLAGRLKRLQERIRAGEHRFADGKDLDFVELVRKNRQAIPFYNILEALNTAHREGVKPE